MNVELSHDPCDLRVYIRCILDDGYQLSLAISHNAIPDRYRNHYDPIPFIRDEVYSTFARAWEDHHIDAETSAHEREFRETERTCSVPALISYAYARWQLARRRAEEHYRGQRRYHLGRRNAPYYAPRFNPNIAEGIYVPTTSPDYLPTNEAEKRGIDLLKRYLTKEQREDFERSRNFKVVGNHTKKTYLITYGRQMNIQPLGRDGKPDGTTMCFLTVGGLCIGDTMLAQKLSLENDEKETLKVANIFR
jgi:hypothetical protein